MNALRILIAAALIFSQAASPASAHQDGRRFLDPGLVPAEGRTAQDFVPSGWRTEGQAEGDLNGDGLPDAALRLVEDLPVKRDDVYTDRYRALVVLFKDPAGGYRRGAVAAKLVYCSTCGGMLGDPDGGNISVEIRNGVLNVMQLSGAREAHELTQRFRLDRSAGRFVLIGEDIDSYDRLTGEGTYVSANYLTGVRVTRKTKVFKEGGEPRTVSDRRTRFRPTRRFIEEVDYER